MKLCISPSPKSYREDGGGIWQVIRAQARYLPTYNVDIVDTPEEADVVCIHAGALVETDKPIVTVNHGLYWTGDFEWEKEYWNYNAAVIEALRRAHDVIVPSEWIAQPIARDMRIDAHIIPHGIDLESLPPGEDKGYVLWAKPRIDVVSDPAPMNELAKIALETNFISTFGRPTGNVKIVGVQPRKDFLETLSGASVWLATTRETGDIASREAMAMGIPVLGWDWGATGELVLHKETGYLAKPGDYSDLLAGLQFCLANRNWLGPIAQAHIQLSYQWKDLMEHYARVFRNVMDERPCEVSIVIPTHNYAHLLPEALDSIVNQSVYNFEVIVVDDGSTDNTKEIIDSYRVKLPIKYFHQQNKGLCAALNKGHLLAEGKYIIHLDPDNLFPPKTLEILSTALNEKPWLDVVGGGLAIYNQDGNHPTANDWPWGKISLDAQLDHYNQLHSSAMVRAQKVKRLGGYRLRQYKNEDGEFWCRAMSAGLRFEQVTDEPTLVYRWHDGNKSKLEGGEDDPKGHLSWNWFYPWREKKNLTPFAMTNNPPKGAWPVRSYHDPHIAVVIPCGKGHDKYLVDALDSVYGQTFRSFECIVANNTGATLDVARMGHPWVKVVEAPEGPAVARNLAIAHAKAPLIVPLDADDILEPDALYNLYVTWLHFPNSLVYADCFTEGTPGRRKKYYSGNWSWRKIQRQAIYQVTTLYAKQWWEAVRGYDAGVPWEDWLFGVKLHIAGIGATYLKKPWGTYRHWTGNRADTDSADYGTPAFFDKMQRMYDWINNKEAEMGCKGCGGRAPSRTTTGEFAPTVVSGEEALIIYDGGRKGSFSLNSKVIPGRKYHMQPGKPVRVAVEDIKWIETMKDYHRVMQLVEAIPTVPPKPPEIAVDWQTEQPDELIDEMTILTNIPWLPGRTLERIRQAGFTSIREITEDLKSGGKKLRKVHRVGPVLVQRMKELLI